MWGIQKDSSLAIYSMMVDLMAVLREQRTGLVRHWGPMMGFERAATMDHPRVDWMASKMAQWSM